MPVARRGFAPSSRHLFPDQVFHVRVVEGVHVLADEIIASSVQVQLAVSRAQGDVLPRRGYLAAAHRLRPRAVHPGQVEEMQVVVPLPLPLAAEEDRRGVVEQNHRSVLARRGFVSVGGELRPFIRAHVVREQVIQAFLICAPAAKHEQTLARVVEHRRVSVAFARSIARGLGLFVPHHPIEVGDEQVVRLSLVAVRQRPAEDEKVVGAPREGVSRAQVRAIVQRIRRTTVTRVLSLPLDLHAVLEVVSHGGGHRLEPLDLLLNQSLLLVAKKLEKLGDGAL